MVELRWEDMLRCGLEAMNPLALEKTEEKAMLALCESGVWRVVGYRLLLKF